MHAVSTELARKIQRFVLWSAIYGLVALAAATAIAYVVDYAVFRHRVATNLAFAQLTVNHYYAVPEKSGKTEFIFDPPQTQTCANALFPRAGYAPCWWLRKHTDQRTNM